MKNKKCHCCDGDGVERDDVVIGAQLRKLRLSLKIPLKSVAMAVGVSPPMMVFLEKGQRHWKPEWIEAYRTECGADSAR